AVALLKEHPYFESRWQRQMEQLPEEDRDRFLFVMAARWPDDARGDEEFHNAEWHYINLPFKPAGPPARVHPRDPDPVNVQRGFAANRAALRDRGAADEARAVALAWLAHLVGDVHQPPHTAALFTTDFPEGDRGGTRFFIRVREDGGVISLHQFWDGLVL